MRGKQAVFASVGGANAGSLTLTGDAALPWRSPVRAVARDAALPWWPPVRTVSRDAALPWPPVRTVSRDAALPWHDSVRRSEGHGAGPVSGAICTDGHECTASAVVARGRLMCQRARAAPARSIGR